MREQREQFGRVVGLVEAVELPDGRACSRGVVRATAFAVPASGATRFSNHA